MVLQERQSSEHVLLTGATGLVGRLVLARLLDCGISVAVLVRSHRQYPAVHRLEHVVRKLETKVGRLLPRPRIIEGTLNRADLGLSGEHLDWIKAHCRSVIHSAASISFSPASQHPENEPYRTNIDGTRYLLDLTTAAGISEWHYVSTAYIAGLRSGRVMENDVNLGQHFSNDYERSKLIAEQMLRTSQSISSLTIYRPSIVIDLHSTAEATSDQAINLAFSMFQTLSRRFGLPQQGQWFKRLGFSGTERKNMVSVDWVAKSIAEIYRRPSLHQQTYHLTNKVGTTALQLENAFHSAMLQSGVPLEKQHPQATSQIDELAAPFVAAFQPYFRDDPEFDRTNIEQALKICKSDDQSPLHAEELTQFCLRQTSPSTALSKRQSHSAVTPLSHDAWSRLICELNDSGRTAGTSEIVYLQLNGMDGGHWILWHDAASDQIISREGRSSGLRVITNRSTWLNLLTGQTTLEEALSAGVLLIEDDDIATNTTADRPHLNAVNEDLNVLSRPSPVRSALLSTLIDRLGRQYRCLSVEAAALDNSSGHQSEVSRVG